MGLQPGSQIGPYTIGERLGAGGMGEVYRASDGKLKREVAIKILPDDLARDPDRLARFRREAQLLAALNHPNIGAIYGLEESAGTQCLILELIEGQTLAEVIPGGGMPVEQALPLALQIAEALEAAHARGIVHRDLKPANIKVTPEGNVKVLDFGLAKAFTGDAGVASSDISMSPTLTGAATQAGVIIGTAAYMSPEQAAGQSTDFRADIWSFGAVLMEMLSGRRMFSGETVSHTLASVLKEDPDWDTLPPRLPGRLREMLRRCLVKKPRQRLQSIGEARIVIEDYLADPAALEEPAPGAGEKRTPALAGRKALLPWAVVALLAVSLPLAIWWFRGASPSSERPPRRTSILLPDGEFPFRGYGSSVVFSPDGSRIAYTTEGEDGRSLFLRYIDQWEGKVIASAPSNDGPYHPFFSPDGEWIGFVTPTDMKKVSIRGGNPITLCPVEYNRGADWGEDGRIVFASSPAGALSIVSSAGGEPTALTELDQDAGEVSHRWPQWLPGQKAVLFTALTEASNFNSATLEIFEPQSGERRTVHRGGTYGRYAPRSGHIVFVNQGTLFALPFDVDSLQVTGQAAPVVEGIASNREQGGAQYDLSDDGSLLYITGPPRQSGGTLVWSDRQGATSPLWDQAQEYGNPEFSPDGTLLAVDIESEGYRDIWVYDLTRDVPTRLTFADGEDFSPVWSPDGATIYFSSERGGMENIYRKPADGSGEAELVLESDKYSVPRSISPDGRFLIYRRSEGSRPDLWILPLDGSEPSPFHSTPGIDYDGRYSPDGQFIVYGSDESGTFQVYVRPATGDRGRWQVSTDTGIYPQWSPDGRFIYYMTPNGMMSVRVETGGRSFKPGRPEMLFGMEKFVFRIAGNHSYAVAPDGERFLMTRKEGEGLSASHGHLRMVFDWTDELRRTFAPRVEQ